MGNCCGITTNQEITQRCYSPKSQTEDPNFPYHEDTQIKETLQNNNNTTSNPQFLGHPPIIPQKRKDPNFLFNEKINSTVSTRCNTPFLGTPDFNMMRSRPAGSSSPSNEPGFFLDARILSILEFFRDLYVRKKVMYERIIPAHEEAFEDIFKKMGKIQQQEKRHNNMGNMLKQRSRSFGDVDELKMERFKVKPIDSGGSKGGTPDKPAGASK